MLKNGDLQTALEQLQAREETLIQLESLAGLGSWTIDLKNNKSFWSEQSYKIYGIDRNVEPSIELFLEHVHPDDLEYIKKEIKEVIKSKSPRIRQCRIINEKTHETRYVVLSAKTIFDENDNPIKIIGTTQDITNQIILQQEELELFNIIDKSSNEIYILDVNTHKYLYVNEGAKDNLGYTLEEMLQKDIFDINPTLTKKQVNKFLEMYKDIGSMTNRSIHKRKDGSIYYVQSYIHFITYKGKKAYIIFDIDITKQIEIEQKLMAQSKMLEEMAYTDSLTQIYNRQKFLKLLQKERANQKRYNDNLSLIMFDIDHFKNINDTYGHDIGDKVLISLTKLIKKNLRITDIFARWGGEEFMILLPRTNIDNAYKKAQQLRKIVEEYEENGLPKITISLGVTQIKKEDDEHSYYKRVDEALYKAKEKRNDVIKY